MGRRAAIAGRPPRQRVIETVETVNGWDIVRERATRSTTYWSIQACDAAGYRIAHHECADRASARTLARSSPAPAARVA